MSKQVKAIIYRIANPIYDVVFKCLLENLDVAKDFLSAILGRQVVSLRLIKQEHIDKGVTDGKARYFRLDFCAVILTQSGQYLQVIIELQKSRILADIIRFRHYLATQYAVTEEILTDTGLRHEPLPIISIYLLGFTLDEKLPMAVQVRRDYVDAVTRRKIAKPPKPDFIEKLTHDAYFIQIPKISGLGDTELEQMLSVFDQNLRVEGNPHKLDFRVKGKKLSHSLERMLRLLTKLQADKEMQKIMEYEDMVAIEQERLKAEWTRDLELKLEQAQKAKEEERKAKEEERKAKEEAQKAKEEAQKAKEEAQKEIQRLRKKLKEKK